MLLIDTRTKFKQRMKAEYKIRKEFRRYMFRLGICFGVGMRRPSWNKSQAIQQVIMLKRLLETTSSDTEAEPLKKLYIPRLTNANNEYDDNPQRVSNLIFIFFFRLFFLTLKRE